MTFQERATTRLVIDFTYLVMMMARRTRKTTIFQWKYYVKHLMQNKQFLRLLGIYRESSRYANSSLSNSTDATFQKGLLKFYLCDFPR